MEERFSKWVIFLLSNLTLLCSWVATPLIVWQLWQDSEAILVFVLCACFTVTLLIVAAVSFALQQREEVNTATSLALHLTVLPVLPWRSCSRRWYNELRMLHASLHSAPACCVAWYHVFSAYYHNIPYRFLLIASISLIDLAWSFRSFALLQRTDGAAACPATARLISQLGFVISRVFSLCLYASIYKLYVFVFALMHCLTVLCGMMGLNLLNRQDAEKLSSIVNVQSSAQAMSFAIITLFAMLEIVNVKTTTCYTPLYNAVMYTLALLENSLLIGLWYSQWISVDFDPWYKLPALLLVYLCFALGCSLSLGLHSATPSIAPSASSPTQNKDALPSPTLSERAFANLTALTTTSTLVLDRPSQSQINPHAFMESTTDRSSNAPSPPLPRFTSTPVRSQNTAVIATSELRVGQTYSSAAILALEGTSNNGSVRRQTRRRRYRSSGATPSQGSSSSSEGEGEVRRAASRRRTRRRRLVGGRSVPGALEKRTGMFGEEVEKREGMFGEELETPF